MKITLRGISLWFLKKTPPPTTTTTEKTTPSLTYKALDLFSASDRAEPFKKLSGGIKFVQDIPKSLGGRLLRKVIREQVLEEMGITPGSSKTGKGFSRKDYGGRASLI